MNSVVVQRELGFVMGTLGKGEGGNVYISPVEGMLATSQLQM